MKIRQVELKGDEWWFQDGRFFKLPKVYSNIYSKSFFL